MKKFNWNLFLCYIVIFSYIVLGNAATFNIGNRLPIKLAEIISIIVIIFLIFNNNHNKKRSNFNFKILIWVLIGFISLIINYIKFNYSINDVVYGAFYGFRIVHLIVLCSLIKDSFDKTSIKKILDFVINCYIVVCCIGFLQVIFFPKAYDFYEIFYSLGVYFPDADPHVGRLVSTYFDPNYLASCLLIPTTICLIFWDKYNDKKYFIKYLVISLSILLTVSRSGLLGYIIVILLYTIGNIKIDNKKIKYSKRAIKLFTATIFILVVSLFSGNIRVINRVTNSVNDKSTYYRIDNWEYSANIIKDNWFIGIGYNLLGTYSEVNQGIIRGDSVKYGSDSSLLLIAMTTGIVGFMYFIITVINYIKNNLKLSKNNKIYLLGVIILISALVCCNFNNLLFYPLWLFSVLLILNLLEGEINENRD